MRKCSYNLFGWDVAVKKQLWVVSYENVIVVVSCEKAKTSLVEGTKSR